MPGSGLVVFGSLAEAIRAGSVPDRFWKKVARTVGDCWEWQGAMFSTGYGHFGLKDKTLSAHRVAFILANGDIPDGMVVMHTCDNRKCVRPSHLRAGTVKDNNHDAVAKGRMNWDRKSHRLHCPYGHEFSEANTYIRPDGARACKVCRRKAHARLRAKRKVA